MKRTFTKLMAALALLLFIAPPMVGWGQTKTDPDYTYTLASGDFTATTHQHTSGSLAWTVSYGTGITESYGWDDDLGFKFGSSNSSYPSAFTLTSTSVSNAIKKVVVTASVNKNKSCKLDVKVGTTTYGTQATINTKQNDSWEFSIADASTVNGAVELSFTSNTGPLYLKKIEIYYYAGGGTTPTINISPDAISVDEQSHSSGYGNDQALSMTTTIPGQSPNVYEVQYCATETGTYTSTAPAWMNAWVAYTTSFNVGWYIGQNTSSIPNECYFKVYNSANNVYSNAVHVTQSAAPTPTYTVTLTGGNAITADYQGNVTSSAITVSTNLTENEGYEVLYNNNGNYTTTAPGWFTATVNSNDEIACTITNNPTYSDRIAQIKVYTTDGTNVAWSEVITVTQAAAPAPYINIVANHGETVENPYLIERPTWQNGGDFLREVEFGNFTVSVASDFQILYCNANGEPIDGTPAMFSGVGVDYYYYQVFETYVYRLYVAVTNNNSTQDRSGYFKVWVNVNNTPVYSELVTVHQPGKPQVATPSFSPVAGAVPAGTKVAISCTTANAAIQYSTDNGDTWTDYTAPIAITAATTIKAKATAEGYVDSEVATAQYTVKGNAVFEDGVYYESMETQQSFDNMQVVNVVGEEQTWEFNISTEAAYMNGYNSGYVANTDWLITPKMAVENGKLNVSFRVKKSYASNQLSWKWSTSNDINGDWNTLTFTEPSSGWGYPESVIETDAEYVYVAFVYDNTSATSAAAYYVYGFKARQYYNVTFDANDASATGTMADLSCVAGVATALTDNVFAVAGKVFNGWNTQADGSGTAYAEGANITITENTTLYAQWLDTYKVKFTTNGIEDGTMYVVKGEAIGTLPTATAEYIPADYVFMGWLDDEYQMNNVAPDAYITAAYKPNSDVTLYAVFAEVSGSAASLTKMTSSDTFEVGDNVVIVADGTVAMYQQTTNTSYVNKYTFDNNVITVAADDKNWFTVSAGTNGTWKLGDATNGYVYNPSSNDLIVDKQNATEFNLAWNNDNSKFTLEGNSRWLSYRNDIANKYFRMGGASTGSGSGVIYFDIYKYVAASASYSKYRTSLTENHTLSISGYADVTGINNTGYHFIASPVYVDPATVNGMTEGDYDLYYFDEAKDHEEWRNYEASNFNLVPGTGYLYAKKATAATPTYNFTLTGAPYNGNGQVTLHKTEGTQFSGWNLIGNPFTTAATLDMPFYKMNSDGDGFTAKIEDLTNTIAAMEGVFVQATATSLTATFTAQNAKSGKRNIAKVELMVSGNRGTVIDNAIVRFDNGETLEKFVLRENGTKLYFTEGNQDYAIVCSNGQGEMPVNFKAETSGTYTISVNAENTEMNYLHLIDNMTGADVDLLATPSYTFEASNDDYESRFRLVFNANYGSNENGNETFAYYNGSEWVISNVGEATLQVVDMMGRVLSSETISGNANVNINQAAGIYMLRLVNGENVMVQKVVVR